MEELYLSFYPDEFSSNAMEWGNPGSFITGYTQNGSIVILYSLGDKSLMEVYAESSSKLLGTFTIEE